VGSDPAPLASANNMELFDVDEDGRLDFAELERLLDED
jgi:hypothetical protein